MTAAHLNDRESTSHQGRLLSSTAVGAWFFTLVFWVGSAGFAADAYPARPIQLVVPFGAGGGTDTFARIIKKAVEDNDLLPVPLVIINKGGAGATVGSRFVKDAEPDGYTMLILHDAILSAKFSNKVDYGPEAFEAIAGTGEVGMVITVAERSDFKTLEDLMAATKRNPDTVTFGANLGALTHFAGLQLEHQYPGARFRFAQIGGGADRFAGLKGGHIDVTGFAIEEFDRFRSEGLRGLAFFGETRHPAAPNVPTAREQNFDIISANTFYWWFPKGTPPAHRDYIAGVLEDVMHTDYVKRKMSEIHCRPVFVKGSELDQRIEVSAARLSRVRLRDEHPLPNIPGIVLGAIGLTLIFAVVESVKERLKQAELPQASAKPSGGQLESRGKHVRALVSISLLLAFVVALAQDLVGFRIATAAFVVVLGAYLSKFQARWWVTVVPVALIISLGIHYIFTHVFTIDLP